MNAALEPYTMDATTRALVSSAAHLQLQNSDLRTALRDIANGADMCIPYFAGAALGYMKEVKRVALAALEENAT